MSFSNIPTKYIPTHNQRNASVVIQDGQPRADQTVSNRSAVQVMSFNVLDPATGARWDQLVASHPECGPFHSAAWARVIVETYGHKPHYFCCSVNDEPAGVIPLIEIRSPFTGRRGVCLPFSDACGPLVFGPNGSTFIQNELSRIAAEQGWDYYEIRGGDTLGEAAKAALSFYGHQLSLSPGPEDVFRRFKDAARGAIRRADKTMSVDISQTAEALKEFYGLHVQTRRRHGAPPQPYRFFVKIHQHMMQAGLAFVVLARVGVRAVAGAVFFRFGRQAIYKYAASDPQFRASGGNNLVIWEAIQRLISEGVDRLHFGRTSTNNAGLRRFKLSLGTEEETIRYFRFQPRLNRWMSAEVDGAGVSRRVFRNLPLSVNRMIGALAYQHLD